MGKCNNEIDEKKRKTTFTKKIMTVILIFSLVWISLSYVLAFLGRTEIAQDLSKQIVVVVVSSILGYFLKSYFETNAEEKNKLINKQMDIDAELDDSGNSVVDEYIDDEFIEDAPDDIIE